MSIAAHQRDYFSDEEWMTMLYNELAAHRPVLYSGVDTVYGGHAFVIDGIQHDGKVHVNWGFDGVGDGYFDIANLSTQLDNRTTVDFDLQQGMVVGLKPQATPSADEQYHSQWATNIADSIFVENGNVVAYFMDLYNYSPLTFSGYVGMVFESITNEDNSGIYPFINTDTEGTVFSTLQGYSGFQSPYVESGWISKYLADDTYKVYIGSWATQEISLNLPVRKVMSPGGANEWILVKKGEKLTITNHNTTPTAISSTQSSVSSEPIMRAYDVSGKSIYAAPASTFNVKDIPGAGVVIITNGTQMTKILR